MSPHRVRAITIRLLQGFRRDRRTVALLFVAPLVILGLLGYLIRNTQVPNVGLANQDAGPVGAAVVSALEKSSHLHATTINAADGDAKLKDGSLAAYIVFPPDFSQQALGKVVAPEVHLEGSQPGQSGAVLQALQQAILSASPQSPAGGGGQVAPKVMYLYGGPDLDTLDFFGAAAIGMIVFFLVFVITIVSFLNERSQGTLERLMASPLRRGEIVLGYMIGFTVLALVQSVEVLVFCLYVLKVHNAGNVLLIFGLEALMAIVAVNLGIFLSMFARTEFQAVQFIPLAIVPQFLLSGILFPVASEPQALQYVSDVLPLTYAVNALRDVMLKGADLTWSSLQLDVGVIVAFIVVLIAAGAGTLRRRIA